MHVVMSQIKVLVGGIKSGNNVPGVPCENMPIIIKTATPLKLCMSCSECLQSLGHFQLQATSTVLMKKDQRTDGRTDDGKEEMK